MRKFFGDNELLLYISDLATFGKHGYVYNDPEKMSDLYTSGDDVFKNEVSKFYVKQVLESHILHDRYIGDFFSKLIPGTDILFSSLATMTAIANSETAMTAIVNSEIAMTAIANSETAMMVIINSEIAMTAILNSEAAMTTILSNKTAITTILNSEAAMTAIYNASYNGYNLTLDDFVAHNVSINGLTISGSTGHNGQSAYKQYSQVSTAIIQGVLNVPVKSYNMCMPIVISNSINSGNHYNQGLLGSVGFGLDHQADGQNIIKRPGENPVSIKEGNIDVLVIYNDEQVGIYDGDNHHVLDVLSPPTVVAFGLATYDSSSSITLSKFYVS